MDLENKTIKELEAIYQEASRNENKSKFGIWKDDKIINLNDLSKEELIAKVEKLSKALIAEYDKEYQRELRREVSRKSQKEFKVLEEGYFEKPPLYNVDEVISRKCQEIKEKLKQPNAETLKSFDDAKNSVGLTSHRDFDKFWKDLNEN